MLTDRRIWRMGYID